METDAALWWGFPVPNSALRNERVSTLSLADELQNLHKNPLQCQRIL